MNGETFSDEILSSRQMGSCCCPYSLCWLCTWRSEKQFRMTATYVVNVCDHNHSKHLQRQVCKKSVSSLPSWGKKIHVAEKLLSLTEAVIKPFCMTGSASQNISTLDKKMPDNTNLCFKDWVKHNSWCRLTWKNKHWMPLADLRTFTHCLSVLLSFKLQWLKIDFCLFQFLTVLIRIRNHS